jgi:Mn2+/Fe2+ NRAMP family transporter
MHTAAVPFREIIRWSVLTAAFIGPGTVTTAMRAGVETGTALIWVVVAAIFATIFLQYLAAQITRASGLPLPEAMAALPGGAVLRPAVLALVAFGCAAFQAGNLTGAATGITLMADVPQPPVVLALAVAASLVLFFGQRTTLRALLGGLVFVMSVFFAFTAWKALGSDVGAVPADSATFEPDALYLSLALFGTTIVPYNLFLGSSLAKAAEGKHLLVALTVSIGVGGVITVSILLTGTLVSPPFGFATAASALETAAGGAARAAFGGGLFAAGFSSALTAPYAAGLLMPEGSKARTWLPFGVIGAGAMAALTGGAPSAVIIAAQAANACVLPAAIGALALLAYRNLQNMLLSAGAAMLGLFFAIMAVRWLVS